MTDPDLIDKAIAIVGSSYLLAEKLGVRQPNLYQYKRLKRVPAKRVLMMEEATGGLVSRYEIRPDLYPRD